MKLKLETTREQFEAAHELADRKRSAELVRLPMATLRALLRDHSAMYARLRSEIETPS